MTASFRPCDTSLIQAPRARAQSLQFEPTALRFSSVEHRSGRKTDFHLSGSCSERRTFSVSGAGLATDLRRRPPRAGGDRDRPPRARFARWRIRARPARGRPRRTWRAKPGSAGKPTDRVGERLRIVRRHQQRVEPARAISRHPGTSVATSGRPQAAASSSVSGSPSRWEGSTAIWADAQSAAISSTKPRCLRLGRLLQALISAAVSRSGWPDLAGRRSAAGYPGRGRSGDHARRERANPLVLDQPADEGDRDRAGGFGEWA